MSLNSNFIQGTFTRIFQEFPQLLSLVTNYISVGVEDFWVDSPLKDWKVISLLDHNKFVSLIFTLEAIWTSLSAS